MKSNQAKLACRKPGGKPIAHADSTQLVLYNFMLTEATGCPKQLHALREFHQHGSNFLCFVIGTQDTAFLIAHPTHTPAFLCWDLTCFRNLTGVTVKARACAMEAMQGL